mmetsp:Transcript_95052/g.252456  ORF Transcript_95052/g.252456 Transcript_95052/m.252456 type:complete len:315 (-) Transcript_95052:952-1896(-)
MLRASGDHAALGRLLLAYRLWAGLGLRLRLRAGETHHRAQLRAGFSLPQRWQRGHYPAHATQGRLHDLALVKHLEVDIPVVLLQRVVVEEVHEAAVLCIRPALVIRRRQHLARVDPSVELGPLLFHQRHWNRLPAALQASRVLGPPLDGRFELQATAKRQGHDSHHLAFVVSVDKATKDEEGGSRRGDGEVAPGLFIEIACVRRIAPCKVLCRLGNLQRRPGRVIKRDRRKRPDFAAWLHVVETEVLYLSFRCQRQVRRRLDVYREPQSWARDQGVRPQLLWKDLAGQFLEGKGMVDGHVRQARARGHDADARG